MPTPPRPPFRATPITTRSRIVLEVASELIGTYDKFWMAKILMRTQGEPEWQFSFYGSSTIDGVHAVTSGESALAIINPSTMLALAYHGGWPYDGPQPVRVIGVIPSLDQFVFAVRPEAGLQTFEEIGERRTPLRIRTRGMADHSVHYMLEQVMRAAGFSGDELIGWGGAIQREGPMPRPDNETFAALVDGTVDAIFDEASDVWLPAAIDAGMTILPLAEATITRLEVLGFRRTFLERSYFAGLDRDILTIDFSGWPIFVREDAPDDLVAAICRALDKRKTAIPWQGDGPLPVERMMLEAPDTPQDTPLHPAATRVWRELGYL